MTRMMQQCHDAKEQHPGMVVLFRNGEFYELFEDDALRRTGGDLTQELTVAVRITGGSQPSATWSYDYYVAGRESLWSDWGQATFAANEDTVTLTIHAREDEDLEDDEQLLIELGTGDGIGYLLGQTVAAATEVTNIVPTGTVPILADGDKPLTGGEANVLKHYLLHLGKGRSLEPRQWDEVKDYIARLNKYGLEAEGETRLSQLQGLLDGLSAVAAKPLPVGETLALYSSGVEGILGGVKIARENEYTKFKQQMDAKAGNLVVRYNEIKDGFVAQWVEYHWLRYQSETIQSKLNAK